MRAADPSHGGVSAFDRLEALRGILAVYVLVGHARWLLWAGHAAWLADAPPAWQLPFGYGPAMFRFGREAVLVFFALSGFFIHFSAAQRLSEGQLPAIRAGEFFRRRAHRLLAPYAFALVVTMACDGVGRAFFPRLYLAQTGDALLDATFGSAGYGMMSVLPALVMLPSSLGHDFGSNGPLWSLAYEVVYYTAYPAWLWLRRRSSAGAFVVAPLICIAASPLLPLAFLRSVIAFYPVWLAGALLAEFLAQRRLRGIAPYWPVLIGALALAAYRVTEMMPVKVLAATVFAAAGVTLFLSWRGRGKWLRPWMFLGTRSFTIYIVHFPLLALFSAALFHLRGARPLDGWLAVLGAFAATAFGCLCFEICERHFLHRRLAPQQQEAVA